jgi:hypothetical protein
MGHVTGGDLLQEAVAELYSADPDEFVARRGELAARARTAGEAALAKRIGALRKPTRSAWVVNQLVRADPSVAEQLQTLGAELRAAQQSFDGPALRELSRQRRQLIDALARQAFTASGQKSPPAALREEVASTLGAALADPQVAEELRAGALARAVIRDGLGTTVEGLPGEWSPVTGGPGAAPGAGAWAARSRATGPGRAARRKAEPEDGEREDAEREDATASKVVPLPSARRRAPGRTGAVAQDRPAAKVTALATARARAERAQAERVKAERERQRQALAAAKQAVKQAEQRARAAAKVEQDQQNALQLLEEQLAGARQQLTEARIRAQRARTIQRQAQRALDRLLRTPQA